MDEKVSNEESMQKEPQQIENDKSEFEHIVEETVDHYSEEISVFVS